MTVSVNQTQCRSLGVCWTVCSNTFAQDTNGKAKVINPNSTDPCVQTAQANCCRGAISIT